jgi:hypothetical protein
MTAQEQKFFASFFQKRRPSFHLLVFSSLIIAGGFGWFLFAILLRDTAGQDWMVFDTAARAYWRGDTALLLDGVKLTAVLNATHPSLNQPLVFHPWVYPPFTLLLALPFGLMPWWLSYGGFQAFSFGAMAAALRPWAAGRGHYWRLLAGVTLCPATAYTLGAGQNSFFTAALVLGGIWLLDRRPVTAGVLLGLLAFKPQFALLVPVALLAAGAWRAIFAATATVTMLLLISLAVPGIAIWRGWLLLYLSGDLAPRQWVELYGQSVFTCLRLAGASNAFANAGQVIALLVAAVAVWRAFARPMAKLRRLLILLCAMTLGAPHLGDYDAVLLGIAAMFVLVPPAGAATATATVLAVLAWCSTAINPPLLFQKTIPLLFPVAEITPLIMLAFLVRLSVRKEESLLF